MLIRLLNGLRELVQRLQAICAKDRQVDIDGTGIKARIIGVLWRHRYLLRARFRLTKRRLNSYYEIMLRKGNAPQSPTRDLRQRGIDWYGLILKTLYYAYYPSWVLIVAPPVGWFIIGVLWWHHEDLKFAISDYERIKKPERGVKKNLTHGLDHSLARLAPPAPMFGGFYGPANATGGINVGGPASYSDLGYAPPALAVDPRAGDFSASDYATFGVEAASRVHNKGTRPCSNCGARYRATSFDGEHQCWFCGATLGTAPPPTPPPDPSEAPTERLF